MSARDAVTPGPRQLRSVLPLSEFLDSTTTGFLFYDEARRVIDCNESLAGWLGRTREDLRGADVRAFDWRVVHADGRTMSDDEQPGELTLRTGRPVAETVIGIDQPNGARRWLSVSTFPADVDGDGRGVICSYVEVTERVQRQRLMKLLSEVNRFVIFASTEAEALRYLCTTIVEHGHFALAWVALASSSEEGGVDIAFAAGEIGYLYEGMVSWTGSRVTGLGPCGVALRTGETQVANDLARQPHFDPWRERTAQFGLRSLVAIPFAPGGRRAALCIYDHHSEAFDEMVVAELEDIAKEVEFGVTHVRSVAQLAQSLDGTLAALALITEARDPYTAGHQYRVGLLGSAIATHLGLDTKLVELIRQSGEVHDVGKTAIPSEILTRPRPLTTIEYEIVKHHTTIGSDILARASLPWPIAEVAAQHHERVDGSGYPHGLSGADISLPARIIAVADVVEAMINHRPYRPGLGLERALDEITRGAGVLYDADAVSSCLAVFAGGFTFATTDDVDASALR